MFYCEKVTQLYERKVKGNDLFRFVHKMKSQIQVRVLDKDSL